MVKVLLKSKTETFASTTVPALLIEISKYLNLDVNRICLKNSSNKTLTAADSFSQNDTLTLKDFGPQISWKLVFVLEYLGPILIHAGAYYYFAPDSQRAKLFLILNLMHYLKREYETLYVHRFSHATMPLRNLFKNCTHYWIFGSLLQFPVYSSSFTPFVSLEGNYRNFLVFVWCFCQVSNLKSHLILRDLRKEGSTQRQIPFGYFFSLVSCPNYFFEIMGWFVVSLISGSVFTLIFTLLGKSFAQSLTYRYDANDIMGREKACFLFSRIS
jgi:very-long-chain enoyl-CoA reductase